MIKKFESYNKNKFEINKYVYWIPFNYEKVKIIDVTDNTVWIQDKNGNIGEWLSKDFMSEIEYFKKIYNI